MVNDYVFEGLCVDTDICDGYCKRMSIRTVPLLLTAVTMYGPLYAMLVYLLCLLVLLDQNLLSYRVC